MEKLELCPLCERKPIIEHWSSGGTIYMVKCNNPDCPVPATSYPKGHNLKNGRNGEEIAIIVGESNQ